MKLKSINAFIIATYNKTPYSLFISVFLVLQPAFHGYAAESSDIYDLGHSPHSRSLQAMKSDSERGDAESSRKLGVAYNFGFGVEPNYTEALEYYEAAAIQGDPRGLGHQAGIYANIHGEDHPEDLVKAEKLYREAVEKGVPFAFVGLGRLMERKGNYGEAETLYHEADLRGRYDAASQIGVLYKEGLGRPKSYSKALSYIEKSAQKGYSYAYHHLGVIYYEGDGEIPQDTEKAISNFRRATEYGVASSMVRLGKIYWNGEGVERDLDMAAEYFQSAREQGDAAASLQLGKLYLDPNYSKANAGRAAELMGEAVDLGNRYAPYQLGHLYRYGVGVERDLVKAFSLYQNAAELGDTYAQLAVGNALIRGTWVGPGLDRPYTHPLTGEILTLPGEFAVSRDPQSGFDYLVRAGESGDVAAYLDLAFAHYFGRGTRVAISQAEAYFNLATKDLSLKMMKKHEGRARTGWIEREDWNALVSAFAKGEH